MIVIAIIPFILLILGALLYALSVNPKVSEIGRISFFCGLLVLTFAFARTVVHIG